MYPRSLVVSVLTGKTKHSVRDAKIRYQQDPEICPVRAWIAYRERLTVEAEPRWSALDAPAFVGIGRHGRVTGGMPPEPLPDGLKPAAGSPQPELLPRTPAKRRW